MLPKHISFGALVVLCCTGALLMAPKKPVKKALLLVGIKKRTEKQKKQKNKKKVLLKKPTVSDGSLIRKPATWTDWSQKALDAENDEEETAPDTSAITPMQRKVFQRALDGLPGLQYMLYELFLFVCVCFWYFKKKF